MKGKKGTEKERGRKETNKKEEETNTHYILDEIRIGRKEEPVIQTLKADRPTDMRTGLDEMGRELRVVDKDR